MTQMQPAEPPCHFVEREYQYQAKIDIVVIIRVRGERFGQAQCLSKAVMVYIPGGFGLRSMREPISAYLARGV